MALAVGALGLALALLVSAAWGSGLVYLAVRLGLPAPVRLSLVDAAHVYVGLVAVVFLLGKVARVGLRRQVPGIPNVVPWQRWLSWSMLVLYGAILATGTLALLSLPGGLRARMIQAHLMVSVWALLPTTWHVWHHRKRALPILRWRRVPPRAMRRIAGRVAVEPGEPGRRFWAGALLATAPVLVFAASPRALSQLSQVGAGADWEPVALTGLPLGGIATEAGSGTLLAGGDRLFYSHDGITWWDVAWPPNAVGLGFVPASGGHAHGAAHTATTVVQSVAGAGPGAYVGTAEGLFLAPSFNAELTDLGLPGQDVEAIAVDPGDARSVWTASTAGVLRSEDGGLSWSPAEAGLEHPGAVTSLAYLGQALFASDGTGVFEWGAEGWARSSDQPSVIRLSEGGGALYAASSTGEARALIDGRWLGLGAIAPSHPAGHAHEALRQVIPFAGRLYAATSDGVAASADGGRSWTAVGGGLFAGGATGVTGHAGDLWAATANGVYRYHLAFGQAASGVWWAELVAASALAGLGGLAVSSLERRYRHRRAGDLRRPLFRVRPGQ